MTSSRTVRPAYVVFFDHEADHIRQLAIDLARQISAEILIARSHFSVLDFARRYKPHFCVAAFEQLGDDISEFSASIRQESPGTQIVIIADEETRVEAMHLDPQIAKVVQVTR